MSGRIKWEDLNHKASPEQVDAARRELDEELTLAELRKARELTQQQLAAVLETSQPGISAIERRSDLYLSTLRSYVEALGGQLELNAVFPDGVVALRNLADLAERTIEYGVDSFDVGDGIVRVIAMHLRERGGDDEDVIADEFEALHHGRLPAVHIEPGSQGARVLYDVVCKLDPPSGRRNPPFRQLCSALKDDPAVARG